MINKLVIKYLEILFVGFKLYALNQLRKYLKSQFNFSIFIYFYLRCEKFFHREDTLCH